MNSRHYREERQRREQMIKKIGMGIPVTETIIDKGHKNGPERHVLTSTGIIVIYNYFSGKMITKLIARPNQLKRFSKVPTEVVEIARLHMKLGYNHL